MTPSRTPIRTWIPLLLLLGVAVTACGPRNKNQRLAEGERRTDEATLLLHEAEQHLRALEVERAEPKLAQAREVLAHPDVELSAEGELLRSQLAELQAFVPRAREERARREREAVAERERKALDALVEKQRDQVVQAMADVTTALEALERKDAGGAEVEAVRAAIQRTRERLHSGRELEARSEDYAASARNTERRLEQAEARARLAQRVVDFVSGPLGDSQAAPALEKKARRERDLAARLALYSEVRERFLRCGQEADKLLAEVPELARSTFPVRGRPVALRVIATQCHKKAGALGRVVAKLQKAKMKWDKAKAKRDKARTRKSR